MINEVYKIKVSFFRDSKTERKQELRWLLCGVPIGGARDLATTPLADPKALPCTLPQHHHREMLVIEAGNTAGQAQQPRRRRILAAPTAGCRFCWQLHGRPIPKHPESLRAVTWEVR